MDTSTTRCTWPTPRRSPTSTPRQSASAARGRRGIAGTPGCSAASEITYGVATYDDNPELTTEVAEMRGARAIRQHHDSPGQRRSRVGPDANGVARASCHRMAGPFGSRRRSAPSACLVKRKRNGRISFQVPEIAEDRQHPPVVIRSGEQIELAEDAPHVRFDRPVVEVQQIADGLLGSGPSAINAGYLPRSGALSASSGLATARRPISCATTSGSTADPPRADAAHLAAEGTHRRNRSRGP